MANKAPGILLSKTVLTILAVTITLVLVTSCVGTGSPTPGEVTPTASVAVPVPGTEPFTGPDLELDMGAGYELFLKINGMNQRTIITTTGSMFSPTAMECPNRPPGH